jgi:hypothetical protein
MLGSHDLQIKSAPAVWRTVICLALVGFLLYNPFLTIFSVSQDLIVRHPLSYRATVAGTELRCGTLQKMESLSAPLTIAIPCGLLQPPIAKQNSLRLADARTVAVSQVLCDALSFRPPPAR